MALALRAAGYFTLEDSFEKLLDGVCAVASGRRAFSPEAESRLINDDGNVRCRCSSRRSGLPRLTRREAEMLVLLVRGMTIKQCAAELHISASTADNHKSHLMAKLNVHKVVDLVRIALRDGLIERWSETVSQV